MNIISREDAGVSAEYIEILECEKHHQHVIIKLNDILRWSPIDWLQEAVDSVDFNKLIIALRAAGFDKNSEVYRHLYRSIGCSLSGYWEIFYWEANNEDANKYKCDEVYDDAFIENLNQKILSIINTVPRVTNE